MQSGQVSRNFCSLEMQEAEINNVMMKLSRKSKPRSIYHTTGLDFDIKSMSKKMGTIVMDPEILKNTIFESFKIISVNC